jgi:hypothetical protein
MKHWIFWLIFFPFMLAAQDSLHWEKEWEIKTMPNATWNVDPFGNLIVCEKESIRKLDSTGFQKFIQSGKYLGAISSIDPSNPMKTLIFSEQQQIVCYIDNTLSKQQENIELSDFELSYVTLVSTSDQPDKFWAYDQDNSKIVLIAKNKLQMQRIENVAGLLGCAEIFQLFEKENRLYVVDRQKGIFQFDLYGTLLFHWEVAHANWVEIEGDYAYILSSNGLEILQLSSFKKWEIKLPTPDLLKFKKVQNHFYFSSKEKIQRFSVDLSH